MRPYLFRIPWLGDWGVPSYGVALLVGFALALFLALRRRDRPAQVTRTLLYDVGFWGVVAGIVGARLMSILLQWGHYHTVLAEQGAGAFLVSLVALWRGGLVFYGGVLGAVLSTWAVARRHKVRVLEVFDFCAPYLMLGLAVTRVGCFMNGCCYGRPSGLPWAVRFPPGTPAAAPFAASPPLHPAQLYATAGGLILFALTVWVYRRRRFEGQATLAMLSLYGVQRFLLEFLRGDTPGLSRVYPAFLRPFGLTVFQTASLLLIAVAGALLVRGLVRAGRPAGGLPREPQGATGGERPPLGEPGRAETARDARESTRPGPPGASPADASSGEEAEGGPQADGDSAKRRRRKKRRKRRKRRRR